MLREEKALRVDGIPNGAWKYGGEKALEMAQEICGRVCRREGYSKG